MKQGTSAQNNLAPSTPAQVISRRAKRLKYWKEQLLLAEFDQDTSERLAELFTTFKLLLSRLASPTDRNPEEAELRAQEIEQELSTLFGEQRLMTSPIGRAAIRD